MGCGEGSSGLRLKERLVKAMGKVGREEPPGVRFGEGGERG